MIYIALSILVYALLIYSRQPKPRKVFAQATIAGLTDRDSGEQLQCTTTLYADESSDEWKAKINALGEVKEARMYIHNERMLAHHKDLEAKKEELERQIEEAGAKVHKIS